MSRIQGLFFVIFLLTATGCADYVDQTRRARDEFYSGRYSEAAQLLEVDAHREGTDQLLYLLDRATALHHAGQYEESNKDFHLADKLAEIKDYTSLSLEAVTLFSSERIVDYKGEDFENALISQYLALNYLLLGRLEDALVECRRVNHKLQRMISEGKRPYQLNPMAWYISGLIYELNREYDHAYIDYQQVYRLMPEVESLKFDLYRMAHANRISEDKQRWAETFRLNSAERKSIELSLGQPEVAVLIENGYSPVKQTHPQWQAIPQYVPRPNRFHEFRVRLTSTENTEDVLVSGQSTLLFNIEATAIKNLDDKFAGVLAKRLAGVVAKEVVAHQVDDKVSPLAGLLFRVGTYALDQADLRSWLTLPRDFQVVRLPLAKLVAKGPAASSNSAGPFNLHMDGCSITGECAVAAKHALIMPAGFLDHEKIARRKNQPLFFVNVRTL